MANERPQHPLGHPNNMPRGTRSYPIPAHLKQMGITQDDFGNWLDRVTNAHTKRDRRRWKGQVERKVYRAAIYKAVAAGGDRDYYTGEPLNWKLLEYFAKSRVANRREKECPTIDHESSNPRAPVFRICSLRTNKCKSNYSTRELGEFCRAFIKHQKKVTNIGLNERRHSRSSSSLYR